MLIYIIAGEQSGDQIGAKIIKSFLQERKDATFIGVGGKNMLAAGLRSSLFNIKNTSIMGFVELLPKIYMLKKLIKKTIFDILSKKPDLVITIDSPGFCIRVAKKVKKYNPHQTIFHVVAPSVWAYRPGRAKTFAAIFDKLYALLPFEVNFFQQEGLPTVYTGHYAFEDDYSISESEVIKFFVKYNLEEEKKYIIITPGSREEEIKKHLPIFIESALRHFEEDRCLIISPGDQYYQLIKIISPRIKIINNKDRFTAYKIAHLALAKSGTNTLEIMASNTAMIVGYKVSNLSWLYIRRAIKTKYACLINIAVNYMLIPEFIQHNFNVDKISNQIKYFMDFPKQIHMQISRAQESAKSIGFKAEKPPSKIIVEDIISSMEM